MLVELDLIGATIVLPGSSGWQIAGGFLGAERKMDCYTVIDVTTVYLHEWFLKVRVGQTCVFIFHLLSSIYRLFVLFSFICSASGGRMNIC